MKTIDLNFDLTGLDGSKAAHAGELIAGILIGEVKGDAVKYYDWAMSFHKKETVNVDDSDFTKIRSLVNDSDKLTILAKAPILKYLDTLK